MMRLLPAFIFGALALFLSNTYCQDFPMLHYTIDDGLPSNKVYNVYRDSKGYLWFATDKGIARYNGISFETFNTFDGLPDNEVFFFQEDYSGRLWMATYNGHLCYYKDDTFHTAVNTPFLKLPFNTPFIKRMTLESDSSLTISFRNYTKFINIKNKKIKVIALDLLKLNIPEDKVVDHEKIGKDKYRLFCTNEIVDVDTTSAILGRSKYTNADISKEKPQLWTVLATQNQNFMLSEHFLFTKAGQLIKYLNDTFRRKNTIYTLYHNSMSYFFGTNNGIVLNDRIRILSGYQVSSLTQDKEENYWVSTLENGVFVLEKDFMSTKKYKDVYRGKIRYTCVLQDHIYFTTTDNDLYQFADGSVTSLLNYNSYISDESRISNSRFYLIDSNYRYFYFDNKISIEIDNLRSKRLSLRKYLSDPAYSSELKGALEAGNYLYINAGSSVLNFDFTKVKTGAAVKFNDLCNTINYEKIFCFEQAPDKSIWYSTINNVYKVKNDTCVLQTQFRNTPFKYFDFLGDDLIGYTHSNQLLICKNYNDNVIFDSIPNQSCIWDMFYRLDAKHILISTNNFYRLLTLPGNISGIENPFVPLQAEAICSDGNNIYFFKNGSITSIDSKQYLTPPAPPKVFFTYLRTGTKYYPIHREVRISFEESKNITVSFSTLSFGGKSVSYLYSVSKDKDNWQPITGEELNLVNPTVGYYTIQIKAKTISSSYSPPVVFTLYVARPFWRKWWFVTLCAWAVVALVAGIVRYRFKLVMRKREKVYQTEIKYLKSEYKAMNALMNPHFIFNTLNNVQSLVNANDKVAANEYLRIFADLVRQNMHNISKELIPLQKEIDLVANYLSLEKLRFEDKLTYSIEIDEELDLDDIMAPPLLIQPLVENSIKHGILPLMSRGGIIKLAIYEKDNSLYIEVKDNGVGMSYKKHKENPQHESFGLQNIRKRIEQLSVLQNKKIEFQIAEITDNTQQNWTVVTIIIPGS